MASAAIDLTRVIQDIETGVGFMSAGVLMKEGLNISDLTTAPPIWAYNAIGVLMGLGFFAAAILLILILIVRLLLLSLMKWARKLEARWWRGGASPNPILCSSYPASCARSPAWTVCRSATRATN